jgi:hypothetical protein
MRVALVDFQPPGSVPLLVRISAGRRIAGGSVLRLTAPAPAATSGVRLGDSAVVAGSLRRSPRWEPVSAHGTVAAVELAPSSAALVTLSIAPGEM